MKSIIFKGHTCAPQDYQLTILAYPFSITVCLLSEEMCGTHCHHKWFAYSVKTCACACMYMTTLTLRLLERQHNTTQHNSPKVVIFQCTLYTFIHVALFSDLPCSAGSHLGTMCMTVRYCVFIVHVLVELTVGHTDRLLQSNNQQ